MSRNRDSWSEDRPVDGIDDDLNGSLNDSLDELLDEAREPTVSTASLRPPPPAHAPQPGLPPPVGLPPPQPFGRQPLPGPQSFGYPPAPAPPQHYGYQPAGLPPSGYPSPGMSQPSLPAPPQTFGHHDGYHTPTPVLPMDRATPIGSIPASMPAQAPRRVRTVSLGAISLLVLVSFAGGIGATLGVEQLFGLNDAPSVALPVATVPVAVPAAPASPPPAPVITALPTPPIPPPSKPTPAAEVAPIPAEPAPVTTRGGKRTVRRQPVARTTAPRPARAKGGSGGGQKGAGWKDPFAM